MACCISCANTHCGKMEADTTKADITTSAVSSSYLTPSNVECTSDSHQYKTPGHQENKSLPAPRPPRACKCALPAEMLTHRPIEHYRTTTPARSAFSLRKSHAHTHSHKGTLPLLHLYRRGNHGNETLTSGYSRHHQQGLSRCSSLLCKSSSLVVRRTVSGRQ